MARTVAGREPLQTHQPSPAEARIRSLVRIQDGPVGMKREYQRAISAMGRATLGAFLGIVMTESPSRLLAGEICPETLGQTTA